MDNSEVVPGFTLKDMLAHIAAWDQEVLSALDAHINGEDTYYNTLVDVEVWNQTTRDQKRRLPLIQTRMHFNMVRGEIGSLLAAAPPETADDLIEYPWRDYGTVRRLVEQFCITHDLEHAEDIRRWRAKHGI